MSLRGRAFLPMWWGLADGFECEFERWHTIEHMPERLGIPGFLRGRRYIGAENGRRIFQIYEAAHIETFRSPGYLARLNAPTDWSNRVQPGLTGMVRGACETLISLGEGVAGSLLAARLLAGDADPLPTGQALAAAALELKRLHGVTAVHLGRHLPGVTTVETAETRLRPAAPAAEFDFVILVEGIATSELADATSRLPELAKTAGARPLESDLYRLAYLLEHEG